ncbi:hypothetical protein V9T40_000793 [Parthenolecanium corni]|uniref:Uncharacterized protein n=1 Tax=Parthenolecanium corni TaxID=536013 RepID=A0AAN9TDL7_9HEMI
MHFLHLDKDFKLGEIPKLGITIRHGVSYRLNDIPPRRHGYSTQPQNFPDPSNLFTRRDELQPIQREIPALEPDWVEEVEYCPPGAPRPQIVLDRAFMLAIGNKLFALSLLGVEQMDVSDDCQQFTNAKDRNGQEAECHGEEAINRLL